MAGGVRDRGEEGVAPITPSSPYNWQPRPLGPCHEAEERALARRLLSAAVGFAATILLGLVITSAGLLVGVVV